MPNRISPLLSLICHRNIALVAIDRKPARIGPKVISMPTTNPVISTTEAKLLYTLLDAAHEDGLIRDGPLLARWRGIMQVAVVFPNVDRTSIYELIKEIDATGALDKTWMRERWLVVKRRVEGAAGEFPTSRPPFAP